MFELWVALLGFTIAVLNMNGIKGKFRALIRHAGRSQRVFIWMRWVDTKSRRNFVLTRYASCEGAEQKTSLDQGICPQPMAFVSLCFLPLYTLKRSIFLHHITIGAPMRYVTFTKQAYIGHTAISPSNGSTLLAEG